jgi:hypothetical protein
LFTTDGSLIREITTWSGRSSEGTDVMANSSKINRAQRKAAGQRNRVKDVKARARKIARKRRSARPGKTATLKTLPKAPPAAS